MFRHSKGTRTALMNGGMVSTAVFATAASTAAILAAPTFAIAFTIAAAVGGAIAAYGYLSKDSSPRFRNLEVRNASENDLRSLQNRLSDFSGHIVPLEDRIDIWRKNKTSFRVIEDHRSHEHRKLLEIFVAYPLSKTMTQRILAGSATGGDIRVADVCRSIPKSSSLYISFAEGQSFTSRALILDEVSKIVEGIKQRPYYIFAIPTTKAAQISLTNNGFKTNKDDSPRIGEIAVLQLEEKSTV